MEIVLISSNNELENIMGLLKKMSLVKNVSAFNRFSKAREYLEHNDIELVLLDADDEESNWLISYRKIKKINAAVKVVLLSANDTAAIKAFEAGVMDYIFKPAKKKQLERVIEKCKVKCNAN